MEDLKAVSERILRSLAERLEKMLPDDTNLQLTLVATVKEDWPYELTVEARVDSKVYDRKTMESVLKEAIDEAMRGAEEELRKKGLKPLP